MTIDTSMSIQGTKRLLSPKEIADEIELTSWQSKQVTESRLVIENILDGKDDRMLLIVGPCSIHDTKSALEYARELKKLADKVKDNIYIVMRCYFEKPRTRLGWMGLVTSPDITYKNDFSKGLRVARKLMVDIIDIGLPIATEFLDPIVALYLEDCVSWVAIGARTTESQTHRQMASGLSMPVGFKNGTAGQYQLAIDAIKKAQEPGSFLGPDDNGRVSEIFSTGISHGHIVLRGGKNPVTGEGIKNYNTESVSEISEALAKAGEKPFRIIVDCSHANSDKDHNNQSGILKNHITANFKKGLIVGAMVESNLKAGSQASKVPPFDQGPEAFHGFNPKKDLEYGLSITDACIGWEETESVIMEVNQDLVEDQDENQVKKAS
jgi:3-deoxy-7-phosphoheptulonate synthase